MQELNFYRQAVASVIDLSCRDATARIAKENAYISLTRILSAYHWEGVHNPTVKLVALPDFTLTRNKHRWNAGFSYGCVIFLDADAPPIIPLGFRPNCCGVILARIPPQKDFSFLTKKLQAIISGNKLAGSTDFNRRNHFLSILKCDDSYFALLHTSFAYVKRDHNGKPGLYLDQSPYWATRARQISFAGGVFQYLIGKDAQEYYSLYRTYEDITKNLRNKIINQLFDEEEIIFHETHEGFYDPYTLLLGAYASPTPLNFPLMVSPDQAIPVIEVITPISELVGDDKLPDLIIAPHGAGYIINDAVDGKKLIGFEDIYELNFSNGSVMYSNNISDLMVSYRKEIAQFWCDSLFAGHKLFDLEPIFCAKV